MFQCPNQAPAWEIVKTDFLCRSAQSLGLRWGWGRAARLFLLCTLCQLLLQTCTNFVVMNEPVDPVCERLKHLRELHFGKRGRSSFAIALGIGRAPTAIMNWTVLLRSRFWYGRLVSLARGWNGSLPAKVSVWNARPIRPRTSLTSFRGVCERFCWFDPIWPVMSRI